MELETPKIEDAVYDILVKECRAYDSENERRQFLHDWPECVEYRFVGALGFGGKVWSNAGRLYVTCYPEDETPERRAMIDSANDALANLPRTASLAGPRTRTRQERPNGAYEGDSTRVSPYPKAEEPNAT